MAGYIVIHKNIARLLPSDRAFSEAEALVSLTLDHAQNKTATLRGYAALWGWSTGKVARFLAARGVKLNYPEARCKRNQRGTIVSTQAEQWRDTNETILFIDYNELKDQAKRKRDKNETQTEHERCATTENKNKNKNTESFPENPGDLFSLWNITVAGNLPVARSLTTVRKRKIKIRLEERPLAEWKAVFEKMAASPFCQGQNDRGWKPDLDWIIDNDNNAVKVLEGKYDRLPTPQQSERPKFTI